MSSIVFNVIAKILHCDIGCIQPPIGCIQPPIALNAIK